jgi:uncharacterized FAD-dependent dehydrogenase
MIRVQELTLSFDHTPQDLRKAVSKRLRLSKQDVLDMKLVRKSIDARQRNRIVAVYTLDVTVRHETEVLATHSKNPKLTSAPDAQYIMPKPGSRPELSPVIVGSGPCGLFATLILAQLGFKPLLIERGKDVRARIRDVNRFWRHGELALNSNVQFGEGGAGTFSDGKLVTQIKDKHHRSRKVLEEFVKAGAPEDILYQAKPHIGSDRLVHVVKRLRDTILTLGGEVRFETQLTDLTIADSHVTGLTVNQADHIDARVVVLALGHSARDTFERLYHLGVPIQAKPFSMGVRIEHPQSLIDQAQYGRYAGHAALGAADYRLVHHVDQERSAYTFCMCPGGQVIGAASEPGRLVTNGMSHHARNLLNANSALLVGIRPDDFGSSDPLAGMAFQRDWEAKAFSLGGGRFQAPVQCVGDFLAQRPSRQLGQVVPSYEPGTTCCDLRGCLPDFVARTLYQALPELNKKLKGFAMHDAVMTALESRSSSPIRILRDEAFQSPRVRGLFPAGEGAGYAGGIISAAIDGIKVAEAIAALG